MSLLLVVRPGATSSVLAVCMLNIPYLKGCVRLFSSSCFILSNTKGTLDLGPVTRPVQMFLVFLSSDALSY